MFKKKPIDIKITIKSGYYFTAVREISRYIITLMFVQDSFNNKAYSREIKLKLRELMEKCPKSRKAQHKYWSELYDKYYELFCRLEHTEIKELKKLKKIQDGYIVVKKSDWEAK